MAKCKKYHIGSIIIVVFDQGNALKFFQQTLILKLMLLQDQIGMSAEHSVDFINIQTIWDYGEASIALKVSNELSMLYRHMHHQSI